MEISGQVTISGDVRLILCDGAMLSVAGGERGKAGISGTGSLTVYGQSGGTGALTVKGGDFGTSTDGPGGVGVNATLTVNGGTVTLIGGGGHSGPGVQGNPNGFGVNDTLTLGAKVILYEGTDATGTVLDGSTGSSRVYSGEKKRSIHAEADSHTHDFTYSADGATITAECKNDGCDLTDSKATLTIAKPEKEKYGDNKEAKATLTGLDDFNAATGLTVSADSITYEGVDNNYTGTTATADVAASENEDGSITYTAKVTVNGTTYTDTKTVKAETADEATPDEATPDEATPDDATPDEATPDEATPDEATPDEPTPDKPTPDEPTPDKPTPDEPDKPTPETKGLLGDVNNDGSVDSADALLILRASLELGLDKFDPVQTFLGDIDGDGILTSNDALEVLRYSIQLPANEKIGTEVTIPA